MTTRSLLHEERLNYRPKLPKLLENADVAVVEEMPQSKSTKPEIEALFPFTIKSPYLSIKKGTPQRHPLRVGVVLSGGQAPGGHNVIVGLFDALQKIHPDSILFGFCDGPKGILENRQIVLGKELLAMYRNQGGFDLIGSGRDKIEKLEHLKAAKNTAEKLQLDGIVIIGGDDSNTNAAILAEYFKSTNCKTHVIGVPKTIDGDLKNHDIEVSFGFDTACKMYSEIIGNLMRDALSAKKYYFFVKLMGRAASHVALECALQTHPNLTLISEEIASGKTLNDIVNEIANLIVARSAQGKNYGVILIPEGVIEFIPEFKALINELNNLLAKDPNGDPISGLSPEARNCYQSLPKDIRAQLLLSRDAHGNVQVSKIETERLFIDMVQENLKKVDYKKFSPQPFFCGYEGRSCLPSNFDSQYCYALGFVAAILINNKANGYMCCLKRLIENPENWEAFGIPITSMMVLEERGGKQKPVIQKALVDLKGKPFAAFANLRSKWSIEDQYLYPGPIQFFGPETITDSVPLTLTLEMKA